METNDLNRYSAVGTSRRDFLAASAAAISAAFLPATMLSLFDCKSALARSTKQSLLPPIPQFASNPYAQAAIVRLTALLEAEKSTPFAGFSRATSPFEVGTAATDTLELIRAFNYEDSPLKGNDGCLKAIIARCDCMYSYAKHVKSSDDYAFLPQLSEILLMLVEVMPGQVEVARMTEWKEIWQNVMQDVFAAHMQHLVLGEIGKAWANVDVRIIAAIAYSGIVLNEMKYRSLAGGGMRLLGKVLEPDGGINYSDEQNDCFAYHPIYVTTLARLWQITGEKAASDLIAATQWYVPISTGAYGAAEYYTAPSWKQMWDTTTGVDAAAIVVSLTGNTYNAGHLKNFPPPPSLFLASFYRSDVKADFMPDSYIIYDQNIKGPRGRNGDYSFAATGRSTLGRNRGKSTYVGCMVSEPLNKLAPEARGFLVNAALTEAGLEVTTNPRVDFNRSVPSDLLYLSQRETVATNASTPAGAVSTHHRLSAYQHAASDWFVSEAWLLTPERIVGVLDVRALSDQMACSINGVLKFVSGCGDWGVAKKFVPAQGQEAGELNPTYTYGALTVRIVDHDFSDISCTYVDTFNDRARKSGRLVMSSQSTGLRMYPLGTGHFFVAEIHPTRFPPAKSVRRIMDQSGAIGVEVFEENGTNYKLLANDTSGVLDIADAYKLAGSKAQVYSNGDSNRLAFLPPMTEKPTKSLGKLAELASLANLMDVEGRDTKSDIEKDNEPESRVLIKPYRHKLIIWRDQ